MRLGEDDREIGLFRIKQRSPRGSTSNAAPKDEVTRCGKQRTPIGKQMKRG